MRRTLLPAQSVRTTGATLLLSSGRIHENGGHFREHAQSMPTSFDGRFANTSGSRATRWRHGSGYARSSGATDACSLTGLWDRRLDDTEPDELREREAEMPRATRTLLGSRKTFWC